MPLPGDRVPDRAGNLRAASLRDARRLLVGLLLVEDRPLSPRAQRRLWLAGEITDVRKASAGTYGSLWVTAELGATARNHRRSQPDGVDHAPSGHSWSAETSSAARSEAREVSSSLDLVRRRFHTVNPDRLWMTDITEHPTREGKLTAAPSSAPSRGWSSAGRSTAPRPRCSSQTRSAWPFSTNTARRGDHPYRARRAVRLIGV
jgi:hypothetical protein